MVKLPRRFRSSARWARLRCGSACHRISRAPAVRARQYEIDRRLGALVLTVSSHLATRARLSYPQIVLIASDGNVLIPTDGSAFYGMVPGEFRYP
jgi:hypothetical protein